MSVMPLARPIPGVLLVATLTGASLVWAQLPASSTTEKPAGRAASDTPPEAGGSGKPAAKGSAVPHPTVGDAARACTAGRQSALVEIACELDASLGEFPADLVVVSAPLGAPGNIERSASLTGRLAAIVAGRLGPRTRAVPEPASLGQARGLASQAGTLLYLVPRLENGELRVTADVYRAPVKFWARVRDPAPSPVLHAYASRRLDPELRSFLPAVPLVAREIVKASSTEGMPVALACADVDLDGAVELLLVGRKTIQLGRIREQRFHPLRTVPWSSLSPIAQSPWRDPVASIAVWPGSHLDLGSSDRAHAIRLTPELGVTERFGRRVPWPQGGCSRFAGLELSPEIVPCDRRDGPPPLRFFGAAIDALAGAQLLDPRGRLLWVVAGRVANTAEVWLKDEDRREARLAPVGAQLALGDVDGDGIPELVSGSATLDPRQDAVVVHSWARPNQLVERLRVPVEGGVQAVAICPTEGLGSAPLAIATQRGVWIVR